jgi:hypothetical protein
LENVDIVCGHLEYFMDIWDILWPFSTFCVNLVHFFLFWYHAQRKNLATLSITCSIKKNCFVFRYFFKFIVAQSLNVVFLCIKRLLQNIYKMQLANILQVLKGNLVRFQYFLHILITVPWKIKFMISSGALICTYLGTFYRMFLLWEFYILDFYGCFRRRYYIYIYFGVRIL